ncbi:MAG: hypothetical protein Q8M09_14500 [Pseudomonadota bacterium]|nr:hypothetical protein [Pseudomonadota bacterium]MDP1905436.1 hypothetical protein [Pseudomonadota bacterium]MDP2354085.1 hypothetical protein [Pseudomonadota bacterium]
MPSPLENLCGPGKHLKVEPPDEREFAGLLRSGLARLKDAENTAISREGRFDLACNAAHALCLAALRREGYRPDNRYIVFQVLPHTLGLGPEVWRVLSKCHDVRNLGEYEGDLNIDNRLLDDLIAATRRVAQEITASSAK